MVAGVDMAGTAGILDLVNADSAATQLAGDGAVVSALEVLRRATAVRCATMAQEPLRRRAFQEALKRLELKRAFGFADDAMTLLPLFPALLPNLGATGAKRVGVGRGVGAQRPLAREFRPGDHETTVS